MSNNVKVRIEAHDGSWYFVDNNSHKIKFDQAVVDATHVSEKFVEGYVVAVHGVEQEIAQYLDSKTLHTLGVGSVHRLGHGPTIRRVRLLEGATMERF